jgi:hypothetical protein
MECNSFHCLHPLLAFVSFGTLPPNFPFLRVAQFIKNWGIILKLLQKSSILETPRKENLPSNNQEQLSLTVVVLCHTSTSKELKN